MSTIRVQTAQNVALEYDVASVGDRILAQLIDLVVLMGYSIGVNFLIEQATSSQDERQMLRLLLLALPVLVYHPGCETFFNGQSLGKKARQIKVTRRDGSRARLGDYLLRWLLGLVEVSATLGSVAVVAVLLNGRGQRLGDLAANTVVVSLRPGPDTPLPTETERLHGYMVVFPQAAQLTDHDVNLIRRLLYQGLKRNNFILLNEVAQKIKSLTGIRTDLPDEAFLRTVLRDHAHLLADPA
ncbi:RDD family protein [Hymenobacter algoricola]|uniref:RDD family protein n=1 Tax=Hymenobacter algoricola TaxID=486267 RepID=A0ABP7NKK9_9BACT